MAGFEQTAEHIGEAIVKDRTAWYIIGGILVVGFILYQFYANANSGSSSSSLPATGGNTGGSSGTTGSTVDTVAQTNNDNLSYQQGLEALQEQASQFNYNLTKQTNTDTLNNYETQKTFDTSNSNTQAQNALQTYEGQKTFDTTNALNLTSGANALAEDLAIRTNQIANNQVVDNANAQVQAATAEYNFLYQPTNSNDTVGSVAGNTASSHIPVSNFIPGTHIVSGGAFHLTNSGSGGNLIDTNGNTITSTAPTSGAGNYQSNATTVINLPDNLVNTRAGTLFQFGQAQQLVSTANQEAIANNNTKNSVTQNWEASNANAEHSNPLNNGQWFGTAVSAVTSAITGKGGNYGSTLYNTGSNNSGGSIGNWLASVFSFQPHGTPPFAPTNNGGSGNDYTYPGATNTNFTGLGDLGTTLFDSFA